MALPDKSALIGADVTEQKFKDGFGEIIDAVKSRENLSHLYDSEDELKSAKLEQLKLKAKALDTGKVYEWNRTSAEGVTPILGAWHDTGLSELDQAKELIESRINSSIGSNPQGFIHDDNGIMIAGFEYEQASFANIDIQKTNIPNVALAFVDPLGFTLVPFHEEKQEQSSGGSNAISTIFDLSAPTLNSLIVGWNDKPYQLFIPQIFNDRVGISTKKSVKASFISKTTGFTAQSNELLNIDLSKVGTTAQIVFRNDADFTKRTIIDLNVKTVSNGTTAPKILMIGDSIMWNGGTNIVNDALTEHGYNPTFIGTLDNYSPTKPPISVNNYLHEGHSGWETGDFTNYINDRSPPVPVGDETKYRTGQAPYASKNDFNPWIRAATSSDGANVIRSGYVFDAVFYRDRFGFSSDVDCIFIATGTNDLRDQTDSTLTTIYESEIKIMIDSLKVAFPNAAIVLCVPNTANTTNRNALWNKYYRLQRSAMNIAKMRSVERVYFAPIHAMTSPEIGYLNSGTTDLNSGAVTGSFTDDIHPYSASRIQTWYNAAAYAAAAKNGVI